jgi:hypothetical protein
MDKILEVIKQLLVKIPVWIDLAEQIYQGAKLGKIRKEFVLQLVSNFLDEIKFTEYKALVLDWSGSFIDLVVKGFNLTGWWGRKVKIDIKPGEEL